MNGESWGNRERRINTMIGRGDSDAAIEELNAFLDTNPPDTDALSALSYRASIYEDLRQYRKACEDESRAHTLSQPGSYTRYTLELSLAHLAEVSDCGEASKWLIAALTTARDGTDISGGAALKQFLEAKGDAGLNEAERRLCTEVALTSWKALNQPGEPEVADLPQLAQQLINLGAQNPKSV